ncbi:Bloom syndrome [Mycena kentingensis (nom. inval.)]|nr:Bloom syndrome [Mycena kentingensis (nom. inval.)]
MPPVDEGRHPALRKRSAEVLEDARLWAGAEYGYHSRHTRDAMRDEFKTRTGHNAHDWQLDVAEALLLRKDCLIIAGTGSGKTTPFLLPLLLPENKGKFALIISPLLSLQSEQAGKFNQVRVRSVAVNNETMGKEMVKRLKKKDPAVALQAVFAGPEMIMENDAFNAWIRTRAALERVLFVAIDEAHLIRLWAKFRPHYELLARLRSHLPTHIPVLATSATITPLTEVDICKTLEIDFANSFYLNLGNDRPNIAEHVHLIDGARDFNALLRLLPPPSQPAKHWPKTQIFVSEVLDTQDVCAFLRAEYPPAVQHKIDYLHSHRSVSARRRRVRRFNRGAVKVLVCTDIGAMGQDIPDIACVLRFTAPESLEAFKQYVGRGDAIPTSSRTGICSSSAALPFPVLLTANELPAHLEFRKKLDDGVRAYVVSRDCRRDVSDAHFGNPARTKPPTGECCDVCSGNGPFPPSQARPNTPPPHSATSTPATTPNKHGKRPRTQRTADGDDSGPRFRTHDHLAECKSAIERWSYRALERDYPNGPFTADMLVGPTLITYLAHNRFGTLDELRDALAESEKRSWGLVDKYGQEVLELLARRDKELHDAREQAEKERTEERSRRDAERQAGIEQRRVAQESDQLARRLAQEQARNVAAERRAANAQAAQAKRDERARGQAIKRQTQIDEFLAKLNAPPKPGRAPKPPDGFIEYISQNSTLLTDIGRARWKDYPGRAGPLAERNLNQPLPFMGSFSLT